MIFWFYRTIAGRVRRHRLLQLPSSDQVAEALVARDPYSHRRAAQADQSEDRNTPTAKPTVYSSAFPSTVRVEVLGATARRRR